MGADFNPVIMFSREKVPTQNNFTPLRMTNLTSTTVKILFGSIFIF